MSLTVSEPTTESFTPCPAGTYPARCILLADLGSQTAEYNGEMKTAPKVLIQFEICDPETRRDDGKAFTVSKRFTASLHEKSSLRKTLESWRGRPFTPEELKGFRLENILAAPCMVAIVQAEKGDRTYSNISAVMAMPRGMQCPAPTIKPASFDLSAPNWEVFDGFSERLQEQIAESPEGRAAIRTRNDIHSPGAAPSPLATGFGDMEDDIPF